MNELLAKYATRPVPRYTSYPTAPHFAKDFDPRTYHHWLTQLDSSAPISLYLHVPFCRKMCWYCGCNMKLASRYEPIADYVSTLHAEIDLVREAMPRGMRLGHLHWGGGTPTVLSVEDFESLMAHIQEVFALEDDAELAIESDPRTLGTDMIAAIGRLGFTRASFGIQEFDPKVQAAINRRQPAAQVKKCVDHLRAAGIAGINFDLIYGLPHQTVQTLMRTIDEVETMSPDRIALFGYAHVPWMAKNQRMIDSQSLPNMAARSAQATSAADGLLDIGYQAIGLDHYARPEDPMALAAASGKLRRNFQGYTTDQAETLIGLGSTSIGRTPFGYVQNIAETGAWARNVRDGQLPIAKGLATNADDRVRARIIERIMCDGAVDLAEFEFDVHDLGNEEAELDELANDGVIARVDSVLRLEDEARPLARIEASVFDRYLHQSDARHSTAV